MERSKLSYGTYKEQSEETTEEEREWTNKLENKSLLPIYGCRSEANLFVNSDEEMWKTCCLNWITIENF